MGKTNVTLGIAAARARSGVRTLVVDLAPPASATPLVDVDVTDRVAVADASRSASRTTSLGR